MSAFIAAVGDRSAILITDGAAYDKDGVIVSIGPKVTLGRSSPIAITSRGNHTLGRNIQRLICDQADRYGVDFAMAEFAREFPAMRADPAYEGADVVHVHIVAWSLERGPIQLSAHNCPQAFGDGQAPLTVTTPKGHYVAGNALDRNSLARAQLRPRHAGEDVVDYLADEGVNLMEAMRRVPATPIAGDQWDGEQYLVGGRCDVSIVSMWGGTTETVRTWPDRVGETIYPFVKARRRQLVQDHAEGC